MNTALDFTTKIKQEMYEKQYILTYSGEISQQIILALLDMTERKLETSGKDINFKSRIFNVMIGCLQNITFRSKDNKYAGTSMFAISEIDDGYEVYSGNALKNDHIGELEERLNRIGEMSDPEIRELYKIWLKSREITADDSSLGLIDLARRTGRKIVYDYTPIDDEYSYFALRTTVMNNKKYNSHES